MKFNEIVFNFKVLEKTVEELKALNGRQYSENQIKHCYDCGNISHIQKDCCAIKQPGRRPFREISISWKPLVRNDSTIGTPSLNTLQYLIPDRIADTTNSEISLKKIKISPHSEPINEVNISSKIPDNTFLGMITRNLDHFS